MGNYMVLDVRHLIHALYQNIGDQILDVLSGASPSTQRRLLGTFSEIARMNLREEPTWKPLEFIYQNNPPFTPRYFLDHAILNRPGPVGARTRLKTVETRLTELVNQYASAQGRVDILDIGTGSGRYVIKTIKALGGSVDIHVTCIDRDEGAITYAKALADKSGVDGHDKNLKFVVEDYNFSQAQSAEDGERKYDIVLFIGVLDYLHPDGVAIRMLRSIRDKKLKSGGTLLTSNVTEHDLRWAMDVVGWKLHYRTMEEVERMLNRTQLDFRVWYEPTRVFVMGEGKKPRSYI